MTDPDRLNIPYVDWDTFHKYDLGSKKRLPIIKTMHPLSFAIDAGLEKAKGSVDTSTLSKWLWGHFGGNVPKSEDERFMETVGKRTKRA